MILVLILISHIVTIAVSRYRCDVFRVPSVAEHWYRSKTMNNTEGSGIAKGTRSPRRDLNIHVSHWYPSNATDGTMRVILSHIGQNGKMVLVPVVLNPAF